MAVLALDANGEQLLTFPLATLEWTSSKDIQASSKDTALVADVVKYSYSSLNVEQAMTELICCGSLLQVALTAAGKEACSKQILQCLSSYQNLCNNSCVASGGFVSSCVAALKAHKMTMKFLEKGKTEIAMKQFAKCGDTALAMEKIAGEIEAEAAKLVTQTEAGLLQACEDRNLSEHERREMETKINETKDKQAKLSKKVEGLTADILEAKEEAAEAQRRADAEEERKHGLKEMFCNTLQTLASSATTLTPGKPLSFTPGKPFAVCLTLEVAAPPPSAGQDAAGAARQQAAEAKKRQRDLQDLKRDLNAELAQSLSELGHQSVKENQLAETVKLLTVCYQTLGKIVTTFKDVRMFWQSVAAHCKQLDALGKDASDYVELSDGEVDLDVTKSMYMSATNWAALGSVCLRAHDAMIAAKGRTDAVMTSLPDGESCDKQIQDMLKVLQKTLAEQEESFAIPDGDDGC